MLASTALEQQAYRFDDRFALSGGEDAHFFRRLHGAGHRIVWSDRAVVRESVQPEQVTAAWIVRRSFSLGWRVARIERDLHPGLASLGRILIAIGLRLPPGLIRVCVFAAGPKHRRIDALQRIAAGLGRATALLGLNLPYFKPAAGDGPQSLPKSVP